MSCLVTMKAVYVYDINLNIVHCVHYFNIFVSSSQYTYA